MRVPETCTATVETVPAALSGTGAASLPWPLMGVGLLAVFLGVVVVLVVARHTRTQRGRAPKAMLAAALLLGASIGVTGLSGVGATPAQAATSEVTYSDGCALFAIDVGETQPPGATNLLPGDTQTAVTVTVTNRFTAAIKIAASAELEGTTPLVASVHLDGVVHGTGDGPVALAPGVSTQIDVLVELPSHTGNEHQGSQVGLTLTVSGAES